MQYAVNLVNPDVDPIREEWKKYQAEAFLVILAHPENDEEREKLDKDLEFAMEHGQRALNAGIASTPLLYTVLQFEEKLGIAEFYTHRETGDAMYVVPLYKAVQGAQVAFAAMVQGMMMAQQLSWVAEQEREKKAKEATLGFMMSGGKVGHA